MTPRAERLLQLLDLLRQYRRPVTADILAEKLFISVRTVYRDIDALRNQGADIRGETGLGFVLHHDFLLPPLVFSENEVEALVLGMRWVFKQGDPEMVEQASRILSKVKAILPESLAETFDSQFLYPVTPDSTHNDTEVKALVLIRQALKEKKSLTFCYLDKHGQATERSVIPLAIGYFDSVKMMAAYCKLRESFRHFRTDSMSDVVIGEHYLKSHRMLLKEWQESQNIDLDKYNL